jgi:hypothetical protein
LALPQEADDEFWAATEPSLEGVTGRYFVNRKARQSPSASYDPQAQAQLWRLLQLQTGADFTLPVDPPV